MDNQQTNVAGAGILVPLLTTLFVYLKLVGHIDWSWWWVFSPVWLSILVPMVIGGTLYLIFKNL